MKNKEFAGALEARTLEFAVNIIKLASKLPNTAEVRVVEHKLPSLEHHPAPTIEKPTDREAELILKARSGFGKAN